MYKGPLIHRQFIKALHSNFNNNTSPILESFAQYAAYQVSLRSRLCAILGRCQPTCRRRRLFCQPLSSRSPWRHRLLRQRLARSRRLLHVWGRRIGPACLWYQGQSCSCKSLHLLNWRSEVGQQKAILREWQVGYQPPLRSGPAVHVRQGHSQARQPRLPIDK